MATPARNAEASINSAIGNCVSKRRARRRRSPSTTDRGRREAASANMAASNALPVAENAAAAAATPQMMAPAHSWRGSMKRNTSLNRTPASCV